MSAIDLTPFWCLMTYDQHGARMYAYGSVDRTDPFPSPGGLSHRPGDARRFASEEEALAALPDLAPRVEAYVADRERREREDRSRKKSKPFALTHPLRPFFERDLVFIHPDGSALARDEMRRNMTWIAEEEEGFRTLRAFIQKHGARLEGIAWSVSNWLSEGGPAITFSGPGFCALRGQSAKPADIAALWPVEWRRKTPRFKDDGYEQYDWIASLDGVTLRLPVAENTRIVPQIAGLDGTRVKIGKAVAA